MGLENLSIDLDAKPSEYRDRESGGYELPVDLVHMRPKSVQLFDANLSNDREPCPECIRNQPPNQDAPMCYCPFDEVFPAFDQDLVPTDHSFRFPRPGKLYRRVK